MTATDPELYGHIHTRVCHYKLMQIYAHYCTLTIGSDCFTMAQILFFSMRNDNKEAISLRINPPPSQGSIVFSYTNTEDYFRKILISGASILCIVAHWMWVPSTEQCHGRRRAGSILPRSGRLLRFLTNWKWNHVKPLLLAGDFQQ